MAGGSRAERSASAAVLCAGAGARSPPACWRRAASPTVPAGVPSGSTRPVPRCAAARRLPHGRDHPIAGRRARQRGARQSRAATDAGGFKIEHRDFDFAILVRLNRGTKMSLRSGAPEQTLEPAFYVVPKTDLEDQELFGRKFRISALADPDSYKDAWHLIVAAIAKRKPANEGLVA